jgi:hypothetical protein
MGVSLGQFAVHAQRGLEVSTFDEWCRRARAAVAPHNLSVDRIRQTLAPPNWDCTACSF